MPIRLTPKSTTGSVMSHEFVFRLSYDAAGNAADVSLRNRSGIVPAGCPVACWLCVPVLRPQWRSIRIREQAHRSEMSQVPARHVDYRRYCDARHEDSAAGLVLGGIFGNNADAWSIATQFQRQLGLKRYETAFQILHKLRVAMVRPDRDRIGDKWPVEVDGICGRKDAGRGSRCSPQGDCGGCR